MRKVLVRGIRTQDRNTGPRNREMRPRVGPSGVLRGVQLKQMRTQPEQLGQMARGAV